MLDSTGSWYYSIFVFANTEINFRIP